ncbi:MULTISPECIES: helix-turn-helix domain-containing protein [Croceitalea]|uniref:Helix-turn-helix transcriptional regulator n=1 Tax=Croceitalea vernalis TaxID=3075599 RepID=A0ABU3BKJ5_9FLAO|nr:MULTISPECIES: helix-turn-helix transcriptional regulator [unclassified Croceitalea]MDT0540704.1 helix-turn-helix transcriptional regulator [Croceitalea sp. P059]MDT0622692.1 helix-turn-helix transcriptional regulator [Croceitalea sp. P007]
MDLGTIVIILLLAIGSIQGLIYGFILLKSNKYNRLANRILAVILLLLSYRLSIQIMRLFGLGYYDSWYYIMIDISWVYGALIYFYTKAQTQSNYKFSSKDWVHFLPLVIQIFCSVFVRLQNLYWDGTKESLSWLGYYGYVVWMNNSTIYIVASILIIAYAFKSQKLLNSVDERFEIDITKLAWIKRIIKSFLVYFSLVLFVLLVDLVIYKSINDGSYFYFTRFYYYPFFIGIAVITYWIGLEGFSRRNDPELTIKTIINPDDLERLKDISKKLENAMENDKLFKDQELSLKSVAEQLNIKPYLISKSLSEIYNKRFNDFVNEYRVKEVQSLLQNSNNSKYTLLSLAMDAGFNSKSSFNRAVKKQFGISPSELKIKK